MENGPLTLGLEDGTIDVERLLVEPQDGHVSVDSVICFNDKIPKNVMDMEEVSCSFGGSNTGIAQEGKEVLSGEVLDAIPVQVGYFQLQNEFCSMGEEYLLGVEFAESITNLDYGSIESLQTSVSDCPNLASSADTDTPWKADQIRNMEASECQNDQLNNCSSELSDIPSHHECETPNDTKALKSPASCTLQNIGNFYDISSCSFQDTLSNRIDGSLIPSCEMYNSLKIEKNEEFGLMGQDVNANRFQKEDSSAIISAHISCTDTLPAQKRSRKPTQRYIDELADPMSKYSKKRREVSSSTSKLKCLEVQDYKKCNIGSRAMRLPAEETSVIAIQVPFGSLVQNECPKSHACDAVRGLEGGNLMTKSKDNRVTLQNQKKMDDGVQAVHLRKEDCVTGASQKKRNGCVSEGLLKKRVDSVAAASQKKRDSFIIGASPEKRDNHVTAASQKTRDDTLIAARRKKKDDCLTPEIPEEAIGRRKHHRLWTLSEVRKLIDGVSQFGVGSWSRIKKLFFSTSAHRTSVDLKDKWRNLLKASGIQEQGDRQGEKKRNMAWRPLPKSILRRVCELATMYPYPKGRKPKMLHIHRDSSEKGTDITLSNYRRILRSINGN